MCPRMYHLLACGLFQFYIPGVFLIGASYRATIPFRAYCRRRCKFCPVRENDVLTLTSVNGATLVFQDLEVDKNEVSDMLVAEGGRNFSYDGSELEWLDLNNILIPDLREAIQPANINQQFFRLWKRKLCSRTQSWGTVRALPKQKNLSLGRPLGDQSCNPLSLLCRILARFLDLCLAEFPDSSHFDRPTHASVIRSLLQIREQPFGDDFPLPKLCNYGVYIMSRDVDNGYMRIQHPEALQAWRFLQRNFYLRHRKTAWVSPYDGGTAAWTQQSGKQWIKFTFEDVEPILAFVFKHMQFQFGTTSGFQKEGIMMGQAAGGAIFRMVLVAHEVQALQSNKLHKHLLDLGSCRFFGIRFVDDLRIFVVYPLYLGHAWASARAHDFLNFIYPPHLFMKEDAVNPFVGMQLLPLSNDIHWCAFYKPLGEVVQYGKRYEQNLIPWSSFSTTDTFSAVLYGGFARSKQLSSNEQCLINSIGNFLAVASAMGYPNDFLRQKLKMWCNKNNLKIDEKCWAHAPMTQSRLLHKSFSEPEVTFPVGSFSVSKL